ncbi:MAG TPA: PQQ-dependent sugar dehydrogenase [Acidimicrobiia bacterium]
MRRARLAPAIVLVAVVAACSGDGGSEARDRPVPRTTTTVAPSTTGGAAPDLSQARVRLARVGDASAPTALATRAGDPALYVAEQGGRVVALVDGTTARRPVLDIESRVTAGGEQGLLGLVFSPDGATMYVHYSGGRGETVVDQYDFRPSTGGGGIADTGSRRELLTVDQPQPNHNGGQLAFGPDGALYLGLGDGGAAGDQGPGHAPEGNAQSPDTLLGKIVRIDPKSGNAKVLASGLRNPWRFSFDRETDDLWIGDVGQNAWEEIDRIPFADARGANFGWPLVEGTHSFRADSARETIPPVFEIDHATGACAVIGGYVYRGSRIPALRGAYIYTDNCDGTLRALRLDDTGGVAEHRDLGVTVSQPTSFGEDADGELYVLSGTDGVFRIDGA